MNNHNLLQSNIPLLILLNHFIGKKHRTFPRRPPSAPPRLRAMDSYSQNPDKLYMTTHKREFTGLQGRPAPNAR